MIKTIKFFFRSEKLIKIYFYFFPINIFIKI